MVARLARISPMDAMPQDYPARGAESTDFEQRVRDELGSALQVQRVLGRGAMATVFLARETALGRLVALKVLSPEVARDQTARLRFEREGRAVASILHPNVVAVYHVDRLSDGVPFLVLQYVRGVSLEERLLARGPLEVPEVRRILTDVASALAAAHQKGIIHRDVRAANVLCDEETGRFLLTDFGLAYVVTAGAADARRLTATGFIVGDTRRISPEQLAGDPLSDRADIYSFGVLAFELLTGTLPFLPADGVPTRARKRDLCDLRPDVDAELGDLVQRCLADTPAHRPPACDLARALSTPLAARTISGGAAEPSRRLAAVLFADIVGYSTLSAADERAALLLVGVLQTLAQDRVDEHHGQIVKYVGDAVLARFNSTEAAVQTALALQSDFAVRAQEHGVQARLRIGVHAGEVTTGSDGDIYGAGVNIAARLQTAANAGQVLVSGDVWRQLQARTEYRFLHLGARTMKGLAVPVEVVEVARADEDPPTATDGQSGVRPARAAIWVGAAAAVLVILLVILTAIIV
jgi:class 3 adenylate cyclase/tRNA A-37 threonylcarbamoyl transferase component Bud32